MRKKAKAGPTGPMPTGFIGLTMGSNNLPVLVYVAGVCGFSVNADPQEPGEAYVIFPGGWRISVMETLEEIQAMLMEV